MWVVGFVENFCPKNLMFNMPVEETIIKVINNALNVP